MNGDLFAFQQLLRNPSRNGRVGQGGQRVGGFFQLFLRLFFGFLLGFFGVHGLRRLLLLLPDRGEPAVEALGGEEQEGGHEDHQEQAGDDGPEQVLRPGHGRGAATAGQAAASSCPAHLPA